jgi:hypothetical protein
MTTQIQRKSRLNLPHITYIPLLKFGRGLVPEVLCRKIINMKQILFPGLFVLVACLSKAQTIQRPASACDAGVTVNPAYSKATILDSIMKYYTTDAMPGVSIAIYSENEGWWAGTAGYASVEKKIPMQNCHLQYLQSFKELYGCRDSAIKRTR